MAYSGTDRRLFFDTYVQEGGNIDATCMRLKEDYPGLSRSTLHRIRERENWDDRMARVESILHTHQELKLTLRETLLEELLDKKEIFEQAMTDKQEDFTPLVLVQYLNAYTGLTKQIIELQDQIRRDEKEALTPKVDTAALFLDFLDEQIRYLSQYPEAVEVMDRHLDGLVDHFKEKHAQAS